MNNFELEEILKDYPVAVCCADKLPVRINARPKNFIVNTDECQKERTHWTAFHCPAHGPCEFFDSLGNPPETYQIRFRNVLISNGPNLKYMTDGNQPQESDTCGLYCIFVVVWRCKNLTMDDIVNEFNVKHMRSNDEKVVNCVRDMY